MRVDFICLLLLLTFFLIPKDGDIYAFMLGYYKSCFFFASKVNQ